jgi:hypothetical protein
MEYVPSVASVRSSWPDVVAHADWSVRPGKRWIAIAVREGERYVAEQVIEVGEPQARLDALRARGSTVLLGIDVTLGVPVAFAARAGITDTARWLRTSADLERLALPAARPEEISVDRPFYPARPGGARVQHLLDAFDLDHVDDLRRLCERRPPLTRAACPLFWTLGANQVGRASLSAWRELVRPGGVQLWPFDGPLDALLAEGGVVLAEAYPADSAGRLGIGFGPRASKRRPADRRLVAPALLAAATVLGVEVRGQLLEAVHDGFGLSPEGEDPFDATVGLLGVVAALRDGRVEPGPADPREGWTLGVVESSSVEAAFDEERRPGLG